MKETDTRLCGNQKLADHLRWNSYRSQQHKLLYVSTPKVACTSIKWWFAALEGYSQALRAVVDSAESDPDLVVHETFKVAPHVTGLDPERLSEALTSDSYFRFAVVRNPYKRIFSAWQSKLVLREPLQIGPYIKSEFFHHPIEQRQDIVAAFEAYLEHLANNEAPSFWDHHWSPQVALLRPDLINYTKLTKIEHASELSKALREWLGAHAPDPFAQRRTNESLIPYLPEFISERSAELIRVLYAEDFDAFGYERQLPSSSEAFTAEQLEVAIKAIKLIRARHQILGERAGQIKMLRQAVTERETQISDLSRIMSEHDALIAELNNATANRDEQISGFTRILAQRDEEVVTLKQFVSQRDEQIANLDRIVSERDENIAHVARALGQRDEEVVTLKQIVSQRDAQIANLDRTASERDENIAHLTRALGHRDEEVFGLKQIVSQRDAQVANLDRDCSQRDEHIVNLSRTLAERDEQIGSLSRLVSERETHIANLSQALTESGHRIKGEADALAQAIARKDRELDRLRRELISMVNSRYWRATAPLRRFTTFRSRALLAGREFLRVRRELILRSGTRLIRASSLFDPDYYLATYPDVRAAKKDPATHYLVHGWKEHRNPSAAFSTAGYLAANPDVAAAGINPLIHYLTHGRKEGRSLGSTEFLSKNSTDAGSLFAVEGVPPPDRTHNATSPPAREVVLDSDRLDAEVQAIRASGLFDQAFYRSMYRDLQSASLDPIRHYCEHGWREGRNPSDEFDTNFYLATYSDIREAGLNPFWHYVVAGTTEQRDALPDMSPRYENDIRFGAVETDVKLLAFYAAPSWASLRGGRPRFKGHLQPIRPIDELGLYDPLDGRILRLQAQMATSHGIHGFCFDLNVAPDAAIEAQPIGPFLAHHEIEIQFCTQIAISSECLLETAAETLARIFADRRQIRIQNRPLLLLRVTENWSGASAFLARLRTLLAGRNVEPFVVGRCERSGQSEWREFCDAMLDQPSARLAGEACPFDPIDKGGVDTIPYSVVASNGVGRIGAVRSSERPLYHVVTLAHDSTAQTSARPLVHTRFNIKDFRRWLDAAIDNAKLIHRNDRQFVFVNAWNDWNEGLHLEPDSKMGFSHLNETTRSLLGVETRRQMPKVSVIVPNYNHEPFLRRRLDSIYGQSYKNIEVILLDDSSSDQSRSVLDAYAAEHPAITRTLYNDKNSGSAFRQWAKGIKHATGELIWIAESDDFCDDSFLEILVSCFDDESVLLAYGKSIFVDKDEIPLPNEFELYLSDLECAKKWKGPYVETAHNEVSSALGVKNTIPNASGALFKRPIDMPLLEDESWLSMRVAGDWVFYLHILRGGKIAYRPDAINFFRRYQGSAAEVTYKTEAFYREVGFAARTVAALYAVPTSVLDRSRSGYESFYWKMVGRSGEEFARWYDHEAALHAQDKRVPNIMVSTLGFYPGGAEILPIRLANEFKRQGHSVLFFSAGLIPRHDGVRRMLRHDVPVIETSGLEDLKELIRDFGIEALNTHQWHMQKYPVQLPDVFDGLRTHVASLHGMIEHGDAFGVTEEQLRDADQKVTTWVYTAEKNLEPFYKFGLYEGSSGRFVKIPNGMQPPEVIPIPRVRMNIPQDSFVLCCVSRAIPDKGWAETIEAVKAARTLSGRDIRLILVGNGSVYDEYCRVGAPEFVHLAGFSENSVGHYAAADMGIMLTKFKSESFPLTIVDCLFAGKPYIASDVGDIRNMLTVGNDVAGSLIELDNWEIPVARAAQEIAAFASDQQRYLNASRLVEAAAGRYRIDAVASQYSKLFEDGRYNPRLSEKTTRDLITLSA